MTPSRRQLRRELERLERSVAREFIAVMRQISADVNITALEQAIRMADVEAAIRASVRESSFAPLTESVRNAYVQTGAMAAGNAPKSLRFGFDVNNPRAANWIQTRSADMVKVLANEQADILRSSIRQQLDIGIRAGANPKTTALDLAGRINRVTGRREGGILQLSNNQAQFVRNAQEELRAGTRTAYSKYLSRTRRDRRFDARVIKAMETGTPLTEKQISQMTGRYADRLLQTRAETIARTETNRAFQASQDESMRQLVEQGHVQSDQVRRIWDATGDMKTRETHADAHGQVVGMDEPFIVGGASLMYPLDPNGPAEETIGCRCQVRLDISYITEESMRA